MIPNEKPELTLDDLEHIDIEELFRAVDEADALRKVRKDRPWGRDIIKVLWEVRPWMSMDQLTRKLWTLRNPSGLPMPKAFKETVQSALNQHTSQSQVFARRGKPEDDLFYSPKGKGSGTWAVHRDRAVAWLKSRGLAAP
jgi:hypothetical protein